MHIIQKLKCILPSPKTQADAQFPTISGDRGFGSKHLKHTEL